MDGPTPGPRRPTDILNDNWINQLDQQRQRSEQRVQNLAIRIYRLCNGLDERLGNRGRLFKTLAIRCARVFIEGEIGMEEFDEIARAMRAKAAAGQLYSAGRYFVVAVQRKGNVQLCRKVG